MAKIKAGNIKKGTYLLHLNQPHYVAATKFVSPGKGSAFSRVKLRNVKTGSSSEFTFKSHDSIEQLDIESIEMNFLYDDGESAVFMNPRTYEQFNLSKKLLGNKLKMLTSDISVYVLFHEEKALDVTMPPKVKLKVTKAEEATAGGRQTAGKKPVTMESGLIVKAPLFIKTGESLIIDTSTGEYVSRG